jgi:hypothetical protein
MPTSLPSARTTTERQVLLLRLHSCSAAAAGCCRRMPWTQPVDPVVAASFAMCMGCCVLPLANQSGGVAWQMHVAGPRVLHKGRCGALLHYAPTENSAPQLACVIA